ncbi:MAG: AraC family transcriptional regulator [Firmicutes bacterium]|nr:AraC family transcriptional regulator [Bacillota bacterium]
MHDLRARVAYLQGLSSGMNIDKNSSEGKLLAGIIDILGDFANSFNELEEAHEEIEDYLESIDEDLYQLEENLYEETYEEMDPEDYLEVDCPTCGETVCFEAGILEDDDIIEVTCPNCDGIAFVNQDYESGDEPEGLELTAGADDDF